MRSEEVYWLAALEQRRNRRTGERVSGHVRPIKQGLLNGIVCTRFVFVFTCCFLSFSFPSLSVLYTLISLLWPPNAGRKSQKLALKTGPSRRNCCFNPSISHGGLHLSYVECLCLRLSLRFSSRSHLSRRFSGLAVVATFSFVIKFI